MYVNLTYKGFINVSGSINKYNLEVDIYELPHSQFLITLYYFFTYWALCTCFVFSKTNMQHLLLLLRYHFYKEVRSNFWKFDSSLAMNFFFIHFFPRQIKLSKKIGIGKRVKNNAATNFWFDTIIIDTRICRQEYFLRFFKILRFLYLLIIGMIVLQVKSLSRNQRFMLEQIWHIFGTMIFIFKLLLHGFF